MAMKEMEYEKILELLKGQPDVITPIAKEAENMLSASVCPGCGSGNTQRFVDGSRPFTRSSILPNVLLKCTDCGTEYSPRSNIILKSKSSLVSG